MMADNDIVPSLPQAHGRLISYEKQLDVVPGSTIAEPSSITGTKIFTDAAWVQLQEQGNSPTSAGLGICIQVEGNQQCSQLFVSAISPPVSSVLQAEAFGLILAAKLADILQLQQVTFFTDNATLAKTAANHNVLDAPGHWEIRPQLGTVFNGRSFNRERIYHISGNLNFKADHHVLPLRAVPEPSSTTLPAEA